VKGRVAAALWLLCAGCAPAALVLPSPPAEIRREPPRAAQQAPAPAKPPAAVPAAPSPDWTALYREAVARTREALSRNEGLSALGLWQRLEESPYRADALYHQGVLLQRAGDLEAAAARYRAALGAAPSLEPAAANLLGVCLLRGDLREARALADRVLPPGTTPRPTMLAELATNVAAALIEDRELDRAAAILLALQAQGRATPAAGWNMAVAAYLRGDAQQARRLAALVPPSVASLWPVAASRVAWEGLPERFLPVPDAAAARLPRMAALARNLEAFARRARGDHSGAMRLLSSPPDILADWPVLAANLGLVEAEAGLWKEARAHLEQAVREAPRAPEGWLDLGLYRELYEGNAAAALECYKRYLELDGRRSGEVRRWIERFATPSQP